MMLNDFKWYRRKKGGKWRLIEHIGISCQAWFQDYEIRSSLEIIIKEEDYTTTVELRKRKLKKLWKKKMIPFF